MSVGHEIVADPEADLAERLRKSADIIEAGSMTSNSLVADIREAITTIERLTRERGEALAEADKRGGVMLESALPLLDETATLRVALAKAEQERDANARDGYQCGQKLADMEMRAEAAEVELAKAQQERDNAVLKWVQQGEHYRAEVEALSAQLAKAREALKPFAQVADLDERTPDGESVFVNVSRCRDARAALAPAKPETEGESDALDLGIIEKRWSDPGRPETLFDQCACESPTVKCDHTGCRCTTCGKLRLR